MSAEAVEFPFEFTRILKDFVGDLKTTFPEYDPLIGKWWKPVSAFAYIENEEERQSAVDVANIESAKIVFTFCQKTLPPRFLDILYKNEDMFKDDFDGNTEFLPHIHFKNLWQCEISQPTRETIWKYLQLMLFSVVGSLTDKGAFGESSKMFEAISQDDFKNKLEESLSSIFTQFDAASSSSSSDTSTADNDTGAAAASQQPHSTPTAEDIRDRMNGLLGGKLGALAKEIAEEASKEFEFQDGNEENVQDVFQSFIKNPAKLMGLVKTIGDKLDSGIKSGDITQSELLAEATDILNNVKDIPGLGNLQEMLSKMGLGGAAGGGGGGKKMSPAAMENELKKHLKNAKMRERMQAKAAAAAAAAATTTGTAAVPPAAAAAAASALSEQDIVNMFSEKAQKTPRGAKQPVQQPSSSTDKKKKKQK